jgi:hypothetical protein
MVKLIQTILVHTGLGVQINDVEIMYSFLPPIDVVKTFALTDIAFPHWFYGCWYSRGILMRLKRRKKLTLAERDEYNENRINLSPTFTTDGVKIWE